MQHQRAKAILAQHGRIGRQRFDNGAGLEVVRRIEAERDAALQVDAPGLEEDAAAGVPGEIGLAQVVADVFVGGERQIVLGAEVETAAIVEGQRVTQPPLRARVEEQPFLPGRRG